MTSSHRDEQRAVEDGAAAAAAFVLGAKARRVDTGRTAQTRDFDLVFDDGRVEPLEVTQHVHRPTRGTQARLAGGNGFPLDLARFWIVSVPYYEIDASGRERPYDVQRCVCELEPLLKLLERLGIDEFDITALFMDPRLRIFGNTVTSLGVSHGKSLPLSKTESIRQVDTLVLLPGGGGALGPDMITDAVEREAGDKGNQDKLAALGCAPRRHLFIPVDLSAGLTYSAVRRAYEFGEMPRQPELPNSITTVWVAVGRSTELLVVTPPAPWEAHAVPLDVRDNPQAWLRP